MKLLLTIVYLICAGSIYAQEIDFTFPDLLIKRYKNYGNKVDLVTFLKKPGDYKEEVQKGAVAYLAFHLEDELTEAKYSKKEIDRISKIVWKQCLSIKNHDLTLYTIGLMEGKGLARYFEASLDDIWDSYKSGYKDSQKRFAYCDFFLEHKEWSKKRLDHFIKRYDQSHFNDKAFWMKFLFELALEDPKIAHLLEVELLDLKNNDEYKGIANTAYLLLAKIRKDLELKPVNIDKNPLLLEQPEYGMAYFEEIRKNPKKVKQESLETLYSILNSDTASYPVQNQAIETLKILGISDLRTTQLYFSLINDRRNRKFDLNIEGQQALRVLQPKDQDVMSFIIKNLTTNEISTELYYYFSLLRKFDKKTLIQASSSFESIFNHLRKFKPEAISTLFDICRDISPDCPSKMQNILYSFLIKESPVYDSLDHFTARDLYFSATVACIELKSKEEREDILFKAVVDITEHIRHRGSILLTVYACFHLERGQELLAYLPKGRRSWHSLALHQSSLKNTIPEFNLFLGKKMNAFFLFLDCLDKYKTTEEAKKFIPTLKEMREYDALESVWPKIDLALKTLEP